MTRRRDRIVIAKRRLLFDVIAQLERERSCSDAEDLLAVDALLVEFRRRAGVLPVPVLPGQEALPGLGSFMIVFNPAEKVTS